ncbi:PQQ-binding-like beta-propeller repeat protein [Streptomyces sp. NPDC046261]|uniref:outer membrane protein assembly factor BamB family protein n=1 Tax=Streptomyces sp. NPDC046261 TaxID=3157200 RepID=UPI0033E76850
MSQPPQPPQYGYPPQQPSSAPMPPLVHAPTHPSAAAVPPPPAPGSGPGRPAWRKPALIALVLALVLAGGGWALWSFLGGDASRDGKPAAKEKKSAAGSVVWTADSRTKPDDKSMKSALGTWFTSSLVVKAEPDMVTAYDIVTGEKKWSFLLKGSLCAASRESEGNVAVLAAEFGDGCLDLMAIDLRDGHRIWEELLVEEKEADDALKPRKWGKSGLELALNDRHVYATWTTGEQTRRLNDGKRVEQEKHDKCEMVDSAGGERLISVNYCGTRDITLRSLDPRKLDKPKWSRNLDRNEGFVTIVSTNPLVLTQAPGKGGRDSRYDFVVLDPDSGEEKARVAYNSYWMLGTCFLATSGCTGPLVDKGTNTLYVSGKGVTMAYNLADGKERWTHKADSNRYTMPLAVRNGQLAAYTVATSDRRGRMTYLDASTGKAVRTVEHSDADRDRRNEAMMSKIEGFPRLVGDRLLLVNDGGFEDDQAGMIYAISAPAKED